MKLTQFWQQLMLRLVLIGAVLAVCVMWGGLVAPVSAETTALVRIIHASHGTRSVNVVGGTNESAPAVSLSPTSLSFGTHQVNAISAAQTVTLKNTGDASLAIKAIGLSGPNSGDFHQQNTCPNPLEAGASCTINVTFTPTAEANFSASLSIADNAAGSPQSVTLSGTGVPGMPPTGSDPNAQPPADNLLQGPLGWLALILAVLAALGIGTELIPGSLRRLRSR